MNEAWIDLLTKFGLPTALVVYFMWRDYQREQRANAKEDRTAEAFQALNLRQSDLTEKAIEAVTTSNSLKRDLKSVIEHLCRRAGIEGLPDTPSIPTAMAASKRTGAHTIFSSEG